MRAGGRCARLAAVAAVLLAGCGASGARRSPPPPCAPGSPGALWIAFASLRSGNYDIWRARADGTCLDQVTDDAGTDLDPTWSRGAIAFVSDRGGALGLWRHDLTTGADAEIPTLGLASATQPAFSPDGAVLAFEGRVGSGGADVYVVPAAGGSPVALTADPTDAAGPAWSPDGRTVYFVSARGGVHDVWSVPAAGGDPEQVTTGSGIIGKPAVTPDGAALLYARVVASGGTEVVRRELATGRLDVVTSADDSEPAPSPSGDRVAVRSYRAGHADVVVVALDGAPAVPLTNDDASDGAPAFAPTP
jgi:TolB protein